MDEIDHLNAIMEIARKAALEEAARVAEGLKTPFSEYNWAYDQAAAAIRALKDK